VDGVLLTDVRVTPDLWLARVFFRLSSESGAYEEVHAGLEAATPYLRRELGKTLRIRRIPELRFLYDETLESASRIEQILRDLRESPPASDADPGEGEEGP
jgi:ribosome-binding factor A